MATAASAPVTKVKPAAKQANPRPQGSVPLNPERPPQLLGKYAKMIGKEISALRVEYTMTGITVMCQLIPQGDENSSTVAGEEEKTEDTWVSLPELKAQKKEHNTPTNEEAAVAFRNKYELRLNEELDKTVFAAIKSGEHEIQKFLDSLEFRKRRALLMSQKQFTASYPNGYAQA